MGTNTTIYLSYLMGAEEIQDQDLSDLDIEIKETTSKGFRKIVIPENHLEEYFELLVKKMTKGFWNEVIGAEKIIFLFKFEDGSVKRFELSSDNEQEIDNLCAEFNNEPPEKTANVYKYISENDFYHDFMVEHYADMINRKMK
ncbi:MAG: hypothetical protein ABIH21_01760 [Patescibacteria group bacterium]